MKQQLIFLWLKCINKYILHLGAVVDHFILHCIPHTNSADKADENHISLLEFCFPLVYISLNTLRDVSRSAWLCVIVNWNEEILWHCANDSQVSFHYGNRLRSGEEVKGACLSIWFLHPNLFKLLMMQSQLWLSPPPPPLYVHAVSSIEGKCMALSWSTLLTGPHHNSSFRGQWLPPLRCGTSGQIH